MQRKSGMAAMVSQRLLYAVQKLGMQVRGSLVPVYHFAVRRPPWPLP